MNSTFIGGSADTVGIAFAEAIVATCALVQASATVRTANELRHAASPAMNDVLCVAGARASIASGNPPHRRRRP